MPESSRRTVLRRGGLLLATGVAGCAGESNTEQPEGRAGNEMADRAGDVASTPPDVLTRRLPDPEQFVPDEYADRDRAVGTLAIDTDIGLLRLGSDGVDDTITGLGGFVAADALGAEASWDGTLDADAKRVGTSVVDDVDALAFTPESFEGIAVRATRAIDLYVDGVLVIAGVDMVRYATDRGVFGATVYRPEVAGNWRMFQIGPRNTGSRAPVGSPPTEGFAQAWDEPFTTDGAMASSPAVVDGTVYIGSFDNNVYALDAATGDFQWSYTTESAVTVAPAVVDETVYACSLSPDDAVYALDAAASDDENRRKWRVPLEGQGRDPVVADGTVYVGSDGGTVVAINAASGDVDWRKSPGEGSEYGTPAVRDGTVFVQGDGALHALDADSGDPLDSVPGAGTEYSAPAIADGVVYAVADRTAGGVVYAVDAESNQVQWEVELSDRPRSPVAVADGTVYVGTDAGVVYAVEEGGAQEFVSFDTDDEVFSGPTVVDDVVYVGSPAGFLYALDRANGESLGRIDTEGAVQSSPAVADGTVYVGVGGVADSQHWSARAYASADGEGEGAAGGDWRMVQFDARNTGHHPTTSGPTGGVTERWRFETEDRVLGTPVVADGTVYVGSTDDNVYALDGANGELVWDAPLELGGPIGSSVAVVDGVVYVGCRDGNAYAFDAETTESVWDAPFQTDDLINTSPTVADGTVYVGNRNGELYALDAATGDAVWDEPVRFEGEYTAVDQAVGVADGTVYVTDDSRALYALDAETGDPVWDAPFEASSVFNSSPTIVDDTLYVGNVNTNVYAVDVADGSERWAFRTGDSVNVSPAVVDDAVFVGTDGNEVYGLDAGTGEPRWDEPFQAEGPVGSNPAVADGTVYVGSWDNSVYALDAATGDTRWEQPFEATDSVDSSPAVVDDTVYVGDLNGTVYAITES